MKNLPSLINFQMNGGMKMVNLRFFIKLKVIECLIYQIKQIIEKEFDYVGDKFTEEAKKIKYGEAKDRAIYGEASIEQTKELIDEDIDVLPLPFSTKKTN